MLFVERPEGILIVNPTLEAIRKAQEAFEGEAERLGLKSEEDVVRLVKNFRREKKQGE